MTPPGKAAPDVARCGAKKKQGPGHCTQVAGWGTDHPGVGRCKLHGGKTPNGEKAGKRELVEREAQRMVALAGTDQDPIEHLLEALHHAAALERVWGTMVSELDEAAEEENADAKTRGELGYEEDSDEKSPYELIVRSKDRLLALDRHGQAGVHPYVAKLEEAIDRRAKLAKMCLDAGVAERQVKLVEFQVQITLSALDRTLDKLGLDAGQRQEARREFAGFLRSGQ
jgi:hypothetical protein